MVQKANIRSDDSHQPNLAHAAIRATHLQGELIGLGWVTRPLLMAEFSKWAALVEPHHQRTTHSLIQARAPTEVEVRECIFRPNEAQNHFCQTWE